MPGLPVTFRHCGAAWKQAFLLAASIAIALPAHAKWRDWSPHLDVEQYWSKHAIYLARLTGVKNEPGGPIISVAPLEVLSGSVERPSHSARLYSNFIEIGPGVTIGDEMLERALQEAQPGDQIVVSEEDHSLAVIVNVVGNSATDPLMKALREVAELRANPTPADLLKGAIVPAAVVLADGRGPIFGPQESAYFGNDYLVQTYCLRQLLPRADVNLGAADVAGLQQIQNDVGLGLETRFLACQVVLKFSHNAADVGTEYSWLEDIIKANRGGNWSDYHQLVETLVAVPGKREQTIEFLLAVARDPHFPKTRNSIGNGFNSIMVGLESRECFHYDNPDPLSDTLFSTALDLLSHCPESELGSVAELVYDLCSGLVGNNPGRYRTYLDRSVAALRAACKKSPDDPAMNSYLVSLEQDYRIPFPRNPP